MPRCDSESGKGLASPRFQLAEAIVSGILAGLALAGFNLQVQG